MPRLFCTSPTSRINRNTDTICLYYRPLFSSLLPVLVALFLFVSINALCDCRATWFTEIYLARHTFLIYRTTQIHYCSIIQTIISSSIRTNIWRGIPYQQHYLFSLIQLNHRSKIRIKCYRPNWLTRGCDILLTGPLTSAALPSPFNERGNNKSQQLLNSNCNFISKRKRT